MRSALFSLAAIALLSGTSNAGDRPDAPLAQALFELIREYDGGRATFVSKDRRTTIVLDAMTYQVHKPLKTGRLQKAVAELGPRSGGVVIEIDELAGPYEGPMVLPQTLAGPYYATHCNELVTGNTHHLVRARFGDALPEALRVRVLERLGMRGTATPRADRLAVPVTLTAESAHGPHAMGKPLLVGLQLRNGLRAPIRFQTFATAPTPWHGETTRIELTEVRRNGSAKNLFRGAPAVNVPPTLSGPRSFVIPPGAGLALRIDLAKWQIAGGWMPGTYECVVRVRQVTVDARTQLSVASAPLRITVK